MRYTTKLGHLVFGHPSARPPNRDRDKLFEAVQLNQNAIKMDNREVAIQNAIRDLNAGVFTSQRAACQA
jgi:hypothetical protein